MSEQSRVSNRIVALSLALVALNVLGMLWLGAGLSSMTDSLRSIGDDAEEDATRARVPELPPEFIEEMFAGPSTEFVDVSRAAGLRVRGVDQPSLCPPGEVDLPPDAKVIGVEVNGESRAYVVEAFDIRVVEKPEDLAVHVVNDLLGEAPIAVTHCNRTRSTRVLTTVPGLGAPVEPLDVCVGGWEEGMLLVVDDATYAHHDDQLPLIDVPFLTTTWGRWRAEHPDSLVYTGRPCGS